MQGRVIANRPITIVFRARKNRSRNRVFYYVYLWVLFISWQETGSRRSIYYTKDSLGCVIFSRLNNVETKKKFWIIIDRSCRVLLQYSLKLTFVISLFSMCGRINTMYRKKNCSRNITLLFSPQSSGGLELHYIRLKLKLLTVANLYYLLGWWNHIILEFTSVWVWVSNDLVEASTTVTL